MYVMIIITIMMILVTRLVPLIFTSSIVHRPRLTQSFSQVNSNPAGLLVLLRLSSSILPRDIAVNLLKIVIKTSQNVH